MSPRELLGVVVRTAGLGCLLIAAFDLYHLVGKLVGIPTLSTLPVSWDVLGVVVWSAFGLCILAGTGWIVRLAYWGDPG
jgi:hypothetical protein